MTAVVMAEDVLRRYVTTGERALRNRVVEDHMWLATTIAREFLRGSEPLTDLIQVAALGLVKAADRFDPDYGAAFVSFASVTIRGELRRHYRDHGWAMRVPRSLQERRAEVRRASEVLTAREGRSPTTADLARYLHLTVDDVLDALCAEQNYRPMSLDSPVGEGQTMGEHAGGDDPGFGLVEDDAAFEALVQSCPERLEAIIRLRYVERLTQLEIAGRLGISQVHVSRLLGRAHQLVRAHVSAGSP